MPVPKEVRSPAGEKRLTPRRRFVPGVVKRSSLRGPSRITLVLTISGGINTVVGISMLPVNEVKVRPSGEVESGDGKDSGAISGASNDVVKSGTGNSTYCAMFVMYCPVINNLYDLLMDETPSRDNITELLNLFGLLDALMLGVLFAFLTAVDFADFVDADKRFGSPTEVYDTNTTFNGYNDWFSDPDYNQGRFYDEKYNAISAKCGEEILLGVFYLFGGLVITLLVYVDLINKNFDADTEARSKKLLTEWWNWVRIVITFSLLGSILGCVQCVAAMVPLVYAIYPDYRILKHGRDTNMDIRSPYRYGDYTANLQWIVFLLTLLVIGIGSAFHFRMKVTLQAETDVNIQCNSLLVSRNDWTAFFKRLEIEEYFRQYADEYVEMFIDARLDFQDRATVTDEHLKAMGMNLPGHRIKLLHIFADK